MRTSEMCMHVRFVDDLIFVEKCDPVVCVKVIEIILVMYVVNFDVYLCEC